MTIICPGCGHKLAIPDANPSAVKCKNCKTTFIIEYTDPPSISDIAYPPKIRLQKFKEAHPTAISWIKTGLGVAILAVIAGFGIKGILKDFLENPSPVPPFSSEENKSNNAIHESFSEEGSCTETPQESPDNVHYEEQNRPVRGCLVNLSGNKHPSREKVESAAANGYPNMGPNQTWRVPTTHKVKVVVVDVVAD